jgi:hypothetical protein
VVLIVSLQSYLDLIYRSFYYKIVSIERNLTRFKLKILSIGFIFCK